MDEDKPSRRELLKKAGLRVGHDLWLAERDGAAQPVGRCRRPQAQPGLAGEAEHRR